VKLNRLLEITLILLNRGTVTAKELAERFGVSTRTIYRDIDVLSTSGVPVYTSKGNSGGISIMEDYTFSRTLVTEHERDSILLALKTLQATKYPEIDSVLEKLGTIFKNAAANDWVYVEFSPWSSGPDENEKFLNIKKSILENRVVSFDYINAEGIRSHREMEPMQLVFKSSAWYVWGYCRKRQSFRTFRISRMKNLAVTGESFMRRAVENVQDDGAAAAIKNGVTLKLRFQPDVLYRLYDDYDDEKIIQNADGSCDITVTYPEDEWVYGHIMSFGGSVEVIEPEHVRDGVRARMKKALKYYEQ
jgi:predicted DNA-binding transcriptional regulator YafY